MKVLTTPAGRAAARLSTPVLLLALAACGGGPGGTAAEGLLASTTPMVVAPLLDDEGRAATPAPQALPADPLARALRARHALESQARALEAALPAGHVPVVVNGQGVDAEDMAIVLGHGMQAALDLDAQAPVLVRGTDARAVARVADRLVALGHAQVWAVAR